jgi:maleamate amidohydrolase
MDEVLKSLKAALKSVEQYYDERGLFMYRLGFGKKCAMIVIDMAYGWTDPAYTMGSARLDRAIEGINRLLPICRAKNVPVVYTVPTWDGRGNPYQPRPAKREFRQWDARAYEIDRRLKFEPGDYRIDKPVPSAFFGTYLAPYLLQRGVDTLIITGCSTSGCVQATATDATAYGFRAIVPRQCVQDRSVVAHEYSLFEINAKWGHVIDVQEVLDHLNRMSPQAS